MSTSFPPLPLPSSAAGLVPTPPAPSPSSPAESQLDGGDFAAAKEYFDRQRAGGGGNGGGSHLTNGYGNGYGYGKVEGGAEDDEDGEEDGEGEEEEEEAEGLAEVWPEPQVDGHAYVAGEGGVRRRRTVGAGVGVDGKGNQEEEVDGVPEEPKRYAQ